MRVLAAIGGLFVIFIVLWDSFETIVLPRRARSGVRISRIFYRITWAPWSAVARRMRDSARRESYLSYYGPLSLLMLLGVWVIDLIIGFAMLQWALGSALATPEGSANFITDLYMSGTTFFTLGLGDVVPRTLLARAVTVAEGGMGFGFLALLISYLPVLYQAFSQREVNVSLLDEWAGSPPSAVELLRRHCHSGQAEAVSQFLHDWERWSAELLESHLSYPVLGYFRSQHDNQSWVAALTMILDTCSLVIAGVDGVATRPARLTFAMARHAAVDLSQIFNTPPRAPELDRLPPADLARLRAILVGEGTSLREGRDADEQLAELRHTYEPYVNALASHLLMPLPPWLPFADAHDNWQMTAWGESETTRLL